MDGMAPTKKFVGFANHDGCSVYKYFGSPENNLKRLAVSRPAFPVVLGFLIA